MFQARKKIYAESEYIFDHGPQAATSVGVEWGLASEKICAIAGAILIAPKAYRLAKVVRRAFTEIKAFVHLFQTNYAYPSSTQ